MKNNSALFIASVFLLCSSTAANAHRLNVFAYSQAHEICVETSFQGGKPARGADVRVLTEEGAVFLTAKTEQDGKVCMALPDGFEPAPLTVIVNAGEGHQNQWKLSKEDFSLGADSKTAVSTVKLEILNKEAETNTASPKIYSQEELLFNFRLIMLLDEEYEPDEDKRIDKAFRHTGENPTDEERFDSYVRGGIDVLYEKLIEGATSPDDYVSRLYDFVEEFYDRFNSTIASDSILELCSK